MICPRILQRRVSIEFWMTVPTQMENSCFCPTARREFSPAPDRERGSRVEDLYVFTRHGVPA